MDVQWRGRSNSDTLVSVIFERAQTDPERVFFRSVEGGAATYRDTEAEILLWAARFKALGVQSGDRIGFMLSANLTSAMAPLGGALLGAWEVPVNAGYRGEVLRHIVEDAGIETMLITPALRPVFEAMNPPLKGLKRLVVVGEDDDSPSGSAAFISADSLVTQPVDAGDVQVPKPWDVSGLMYTSGTTGPPKGVIIPWGSWTAAFEFMAPVLSSEDVLYAPFPFYHGLARVSLTAAAMSGASVVVRESFKTQHFWSDIDQFQCTFTATTPAVLQWLLDAPASDADRQHALRRVLGYGPQLALFADRFDVQTSTMFAMTEIGSAIVSNDRGLPAGASGRLRPGYDVRIVDEFDQAVPVGEVGELIVRTDRPWITNLGYFNLPQPSLEAWRNGWYHTGDAFRVDEDGYYYFSDRKKDMIRRRGVNLSSFQIESGALRHPHVHEVAAVGVPSASGEEDVKLVVVPKLTSEIDPKELRDFLAQELPAFMVPRYIQFATELPRTPVTQRVRKHLLRASPDDQALWDGQADGPRP